MPKLPRLTGKELAKIVKRFGFVHIHTTGSHMVYKHSDEPPGNHKFRRHPSRMDSGKIPA